MPSGSPRWRPGGCGSTWWPAGSVVPPLQMADATHAGILDGRHGNATLWYKKHKAYALFGTPPSFGWDSHGFLAWFYYGGGEALYRELTSEIVRANLTGFLYGPLPTQPLGWFKKDIKEPVRPQGRALSRREPGHPSCSRSLGRPSSTCRATRSRPSWSAA